MLEDQKKVVGQLQEIHCSNWSEAEIWLLAWLVSDDDGEMWRRLHSLCSVGQTNRIIVLSTAISLLIKRLVSTHC